MTAVATIATGPLRNVLNMTPNAITIVICNQIEMYALVRFHSNEFSAGSQIDTTLGDTQGTDYGRGNG